MSRNGSPILQPGSLNVETTFADGPLAQPAVVTMAQPGQVKILTIGGLSKVEALAGQIAGHLVCELSQKDQGAAACDLVATVAFDMAESLLAESARRAKAKASQ